MRLKQLVKPVDIRPVPFTRSIEFLDADDPASVFASIEATGSLGSELLEVNGDVKFINNVTLPSALTDTDAMNRVTSDTRYVNITGDTMIGPLTVNANVILANTWVRDIVLGDHISDTVGVKSGTWAFENVTTINFDAAVTIDATGFPVTCIEDWTFDDDLLVKGDFEVHGDTILGYASDDSVAYYAGTFSYEEDSSITYGGTVIINFDDDATFDATGETVISKGTWTWAGRLENGKGSDIASADELTLGADGNYFDITGTTEINHITETGWQAGSVVVLQFDDSVTVKHNTASTPPEAPILLSGAGDFGADADDTLQLAYDGAVWREVSRTVI